jgi:hypothetical protein
MKTIIFLIFVFNFLYNRGGVGIAGVSEDEYFLPINAKPGD